MNSVAQEILYLTAVGNTLPGQELLPYMFRHTPIGQGQRVVPDNGDNTLLRWQVPENFDYLITYLTYRCFPVAGGLGNDPWPFNEVDQFGYGSLRLRMNAANFNRIDSNYLLLANHPCLIYVPSRTQLDLIVNRSDNASGFAGSPASVTIATRLNGYTLPQGVGSRFAHVQTEIITTPANLALL
jgi:hypothetical protein